VNLDPRTWKVDPRKWKLTGKLTGWRRTAAYSAFFAFAFVLALRFTFPVEAVRERFILDAAARGYQVKVSDLSPSGLVGVRARELTVTTADGTRIPFDQLSVGLRLWPTLLGRRSFSFDASLFDGRVVGFTEVGTTAERYQAKVTGIDLSRAGVIRAATGLDLAGILSGSLDVTLDPKDPSKSTGGIDFQVKDGAIRGGKIPVPGMDGGLTAPPVKLGSMAARGTVKGGRAEFGTLESKGDDVDFSAEQVFIQLQPRFEHSAISGRARLRPTESFWRNEQAAPLKPLVEAGLASAKGKDGGYGFQIYGTIGKPMARPAAY
jgi:type II secretion system protein N